MQPDQEIKVGQQVCVVTDKGWGRRPEEAEVLTVVRIGRRYGHLSDGQKFDLNDMHIALTPDEYGARVYPSEREYVTKKLLNELALLLLNKNEEADVSNLTPGDIIGFAASMGATLQLPEVKKAMHDPTA